MKKSLRSLITRGYPLQTKREMISYCEEHGEKATLHRYHTTGSTLRKFMLHKEDINSPTAEQVIASVSRRKVIRSPEYMARYRARHYPKNRRKTNPFLVISRYANGNYKLVCFRNKLPYDDTQRIKPLQLWALAKRQKCKCALSGLKLTAENVSIDHVIPTSQGGKNVVENMRLVHNIINKMRNDLPDKDFLTYCQAVSSHLTVS